MSNLNGSRRFKQEERIRQATARCRVAEDECFVLRLSNRLKRDLSLHPPGRPPEKKRVCAPVTFCFPGHRIQHPLAALRPTVNYKLSDHPTMEHGGNVFTGEGEHTFFGQFDNNNVYCSLRYGF